jgi:hypothetical protein
VIPAFESIQWDFVAAFSYPFMPAMEVRETILVLPKSSGVFELSAVLIGVSQFGAVDVQDYTSNLSVGLFSATWQRPASGAPPEPVYAQIGPWSTPSWDIAERIVLTVGQGTPYPLFDPPVPGAFPHYPVTSPNGLTLGLRLGRTPNLKYIYSNTGAQVFPAPGRYL